MLPGPRSQPAPEPDVVHVVYALRSAVRGAGGPSGVLGRMWTPRKSERRRAVGETVASPQFSASTCWPTGYAIGWIHRRERADAASPIVFGCERSARSTAAASTAARISRQPPNGRSVSAQLRDAANTDDKLRSRGLPIQGERT